MFGPSGNITVNGSLTCVSETQGGAISKRGLGAGQQAGVNLNAPPYAIHNGESDSSLWHGGCWHEIGFGPLSVHALATNATHAGGQVELDVHNLFGLMGEKTNRRALEDIIPKKRPFMISRSTLPSSGRWTGHWVCRAFLPRGHLADVCFQVGWQL